MASMTTRPVQDYVFVKPKHNGLCYDWKNFTSKPVALNHVADSRIAKAVPAHGQKKFNLMANLSADLFKEVLDHIQGDDKMSFRRTCSGLFNAIDCKPQDLSRSELDRFVGVNHQRRFDHANTEHGKLKQCTYCVDSHEHSAFACPDDRQCIASKRIFRFTSWKTFTHDALWTLARQTDDLEKPLKLAIKYTKGLKLLRQELTAIDGNIRAINTFAIAKIPVGAGAPDDSLVYSELQKLDIWMTTHVHLKDPVIFWAYDDDKLGARNGTDCVKTNSRSCMMSGCNCTTWHFERVAFDSTNTHDVVLLKVKRALSQTKEHGRLARPHQKAWSVMSTTRKEWDACADYLFEKVELENAWIIDEDIGPETDRLIMQNMRGTEDNL